MQMTGLTLNLGSGKDARPDCINADIRSDVGADWVVDISKLSYGEVIKHGDQEVSIKPFCFEKILAFDVLEHIDQDLNFLIKLNKITRREHTLLLSVPACPFLYGEHDRLLSHYRRYSKKVLHERLTMAGYEVVSLDYHMFFAFPPACIARLLDKFKKYLEILACLPKTLFELDLSLNSGITFSVVNFLNDNFTQL